MEKTNTGKGLNIQMIDNILFCKEQTAMNKPAVVIVDGGLGQGKTTLSVQICDEANGKPQKFETFVGMGGKEFISVYDLHKQDRQALNYDEAGDYARRGAMTQFNRELGRIFETFRAFKVIIVITLPRFWWLDSKIYELGVVKMIVHCYGRTQTYGRYAVWFEDTIDWLISRADKVKKMGLPQKLCYGQVSPNQRGLFYDLDPVRSKELTDFGLRGKSAISQQAILASQNLISIKDIGHKLGRSYQWVQRNMRNKKIPAARIIKNKNYYNKDIINRLLDDIYEGNK